MKAQGGIICSHGVRHIRRTNTKKEWLFLRSDGTHNHVYCRKCDPELGGMYARQRQAALDEKASKA